MIPKKPWKKNLYENEEYPDNYTDESFLKELQVNLHFTPITLSESIVGATVVVQELCAVIMFVIIYVFLYNEWINPDIMLYCTISMISFGFLIYRTYYSSSNDIKLTLGHDLRTVMIYLGFGYLFSPVLHTLTDTISTDTIHTMTFFMMLVHLIFCDYGLPAAIVSNSLSISAAVFASICLSSRLASQYRAFILITVSIKWFVLFPLLKKKMRLSPMCTLVFVIVIISILSRVSLLMTSLFILIVMFINIICPLLFTNYQKYKDNIYGPWDEAVVQGIDRQSD